MKQFERCFPGYSLVLRRALAVGLLVAAATGTGCSAQTDEAGATSGGSDDDVSVGAIVHGRADRTRDPGVVALMLGNEGLCSATLIAPRAVLTARHCVSELASEAVDCASRARQITNDRDPETLVVLDGGDINTARPVARGQRLIVPDSTRICDADVAIVVLDRAVQGIAPVPVRLASAPRVGEELVAVGFGRRGESGGVGLRERRPGVRIESIDTGEFEVGQATCSGDSGGPALATGTGEVVGIVSRGTSTCSSASATNVYTRADAWATLIREGIRAGGGTASSATGSQPAAPAPGDDASGIGAPCGSGNDCGSGYCVRSTGTCTVTCGPDDPCPDGYRCGTGSGGIRACFRR